MYAEDRLVRGENVALRVVSITIDALTTPTDRSADLLALIPGDRIRVTNLPAGPLGFTQWDGWFLGASEVHAPGASASEAFTLDLAPVLPPTAIFDTDRFGANGGLSLTSTITAAATTMQVTSSDGVPLETVQVPYTLLVDSEQITVTACTALSGGTQTATITRGANGTTPAIHGSGVLVDVANIPILAF
jgi:hypothetical protein